MGLFGGFFLALTFLSSAGAMTLEEKIEIAKSRCDMAKSEPAPVLYANSFHFNMSLEEVDAAYVKTYASEERLLAHALYDAEKNHFISKKADEFLVFPEAYIKAVILHVENSLRLNYVRYIFFPDMGHSHMFVPQDYFDNVVQASGAKSALESLNIILKAPGLKTLYHTAEQLRLIDDDKKVLEDRYLQWRFYTRNPIIDNNGHIEIATNFDAKGGHNTVHHLAGHKYFSGFNLSANKKGCFPFEDAQGQIQYFDLSGWDLPYDCSGGCY